MRVLLAILLCAGCGRVGFRAHAAPDAAADAQTDAELPDAGSLDGSRDAADAPDAALPDASLTDATLTDADADFPDTAAPDADAPDADLPDADVPDADVPDADVPDADAALPSCGAGPRVADPNFSTGEPWTATGTASIDTTRFLAVFAPDLSAGSGAITQTACGTDARTPPTSITYRAAALGSDARMGTMSVSLDGQVLGVRDLMTLPMGDFARMRYCLGERALGAGPRLMSIEATQFVSPSGIQLLVDDVTFGDDPLCPEIGEVINGDIEDGTAGFVINSGNVADVIETETGGNHILHLVYPAGCSSGPGNIISTPISIPTGATLPNASLHYRLRFDMSMSSSTVDARIEAGGLIHPVSSSGGYLPAFTNIVACIPPELRGLSGELVFSIAIDCADGPRDFAVDEIALVSDASCP